MAYTPQHCNEYPHFRKFKDPLLNALVLNHFNYQKVA